MKYLQQIHDLLKRLPKETLIWMVILLGGVVYLFARKWYNDYTARQDLFTTTQEVVLEKLDSLTSFARENRQMIRVNRDLTGEVIQKQRELQMDLLETHQKIDLVIQGNEQWKKQAEQIEEINRQYQEQIRQNDNVLLPPVPRKELVAVDSGDVFNKFSLIFDKLLP